MKDKIKNGYFFIYDHDTYMRVGSRCYFIPILYIRGGKYIMFKDIDEDYIQAVFTANGERVD